MYKIGLLVSFARRASTDDRGIVLGLTWPVSTPGRPADKNFVLDILGADPQMMPAYSAEDTISGEIVTFSGARLEGSLNLAPIPWDSEEYKELQRATVYPYAYIYTLPASTPGAYVHPLLPASAESAAPNAVDVALTPAVEHDYEQGSKVLKIAWRARKLTRDWV
jgi:hypothetical protein